MNIELIEKATLNEMYRLGNEGKIHTHSGSIDVFNPNLDDIYIEDIAMSLSYNVGRWRCKSPHFYPVAKHCLEGTALIQDDLKLDFLLHDAAEAYLGDMPSPIKARMPEFQEIENRLMTAIAEKFGIQFPFHDEVKRVDKIMLEREYIDFIVNKKVFINSGDFYYNWFISAFNKFKILK